MKLLLGSDPEMAKARITDPDGLSQTLLHITVDWPGHLPNVGQTIALLIARGADPNAPLINGKAPETPLHGAASCNDVEALDALLDGGANIESPGAIFTGGAPMSDAVIFANWNAARRLLDRGAKTTFTQAAGLGLLNFVIDGCESEQPERITTALWHACRGGQLQTAQYLVTKGANINWIGWDNVAPLDGALQSKNQELITWLKKQGARPAPVA